MIKALYYYLLSRIDFWRESRRMDHCDVCKNAFRMRDLHHTSGDMVMCKRCLSRYARGL